MSPEYKEGRLMATLQVFLDDSGDESAFVLGGFIASIEVWDKFSIDWKAVCKEPPIIGYYRTNDAISLKRSFLNWTQDYRNQKIAKLASMIPLENCFAIAAYLSPIDLKEISEHFPVKSPRPYPHNFNYFDPYFLCASCIVNWVLINCDSWFPGVIKENSKIDFVFDQQGKVGRKFRFFFEDIMKPSISRLGKCDHWNDQEFPPLQVADMLAAWVRRGASSRIQIWTAADIYLSNLEVQSIDIDRRFFNLYISRVMNKVYYMKNRI
jgi:hypothetical protein